jgi:hypothetical protein
MLYILIKKINAENEYTALTSSHSTLLWWLTNDNIPTLFYLPKYYYNYCLSIEMFRRRLVAGSKLQAIYPYPPY